MTTLITGATGLVGNNVLRLLLDRHQPVRVLARATSDSRPLAGLDVEVVRGDVQDAESVKRAMDGVSTVVHSAAVVHIGWTGLELQRAVNVAGTRHVAEAAKAAGARLVHVSSVDALPLGTAQQPADEDSPAGEKIPCPYVVTKREAEKVLQEYVDQGLNAVIVNPGFMLGPWDWKPSSGKLLLEVAQRFTPFAPKGGISVCDVRDVATGILAAAERAPRGRRYILAGHNLSFLDLWTRMAQVTGGRAPWMRSGPLMRIAAGGAGDLWTRLSGREPALNSAAVQMSNLLHFYSSQRAIDELGYQIRPVEESIRDAWRWFRENGYA